MDLLELLKTRRTYRRFEQREIPQDVIDEILTAARYASSGGNKQPLSYVVVKDRAKAEEVFAKTRWAAYLPPEQGQPKDGEHPVLFIGVVVNTDINPNGDADAGLALGNMTLAAWNRGVGSCIIGACDRDAIGKIMGLTDTQKLHTIVAFGYPTHKSRIADLEGSGADAVKYYLDENRDYVVPKRRLEDIVTYL